MGRWGYIGFAIKRQIDLGAADCGGVSYHLMRRSNGALNRFDCWSRRPASNHFGQRPPEPSFSFFCATSLFQLT